MANKMAIFPNSLTVGNMFFGFWSILSSIEGDFQWACYFVILGGLCDALDGKVARLVNSTSDFGVEFDSLSDLITFGAAPSIMILMLYKTNYVLDPVYQDLNFLFFLFSFLPLLFTGIRLARFNAELVGHNKDFFSGLPSPASAITIISFVLFEYAFYNHVVHFNYLTLIALTVSYLMVSRLKYSGLPILFKKGEKFIVRYLKMLGVMALIISIIMFKMWLLFPIMALFIFFGIINSVIEKLKRADQGICKTSQCEEDE